MTKKSVVRTVSFNDATPEELAILFCDMCGDEQAAFFDAVGAIAATWPGAGMCAQAYDIAKHLSIQGRSVIERLADHAGLIPEMSA